MSKFEQPGQYRSSEGPKTQEDSTESREWFGDRTLQAAQDVYAGEVQALEKKASRYEGLKDFGYSLALPGSIFIMGKFFGVDEAMGLNISESADAAIRLSWGISMLVGSSAGLIQDHFEKKLNHLKDKFGVLSKPEDKEIE